MTSSRPATAVRLALSPDPAPTSLRMLIAGGGIGGLAAALSLARRGHSSHILERRSVFEPEGAGIQIGPNGTRILAELGVAERLEPLAGKPDFIHARDAASGSTLSKLPLGDWIAARHVAPYWVLHRQDLHSALLDTARASSLVSMVMGFDAIDANVDDETATVSDRGDRSETGVALIAADGLRSRLRDALFDAPPLRFAGKSAARAVISSHDMPASLDENAVGLWMSPRAHVVHYPVRGRREVAMVFVRKDGEASDDWSTDVPQDWVTDSAKGLAPALRELLERPRQWKKWALYELPPLPFWSLGRAALLGDAAHPTLPFLAQGGVLALEDAAVLAKCISEHAADVARALTLYAAARRHRAIRVVSGARSNGRIYHLDGMMARARDTALKLTPPGVMMARYDWVYGWRS